VSPCGADVDCFLAIGHTTNLIARDSNIIIIRGSGDEGRSIYNQMLRAAEEYFPMSGITDDPLVNADALGMYDAHQGQIYPLQRVMTGATSLVGTDNGRRPGGYVLVIDGLALTEVRSSFP
jgi:phospholipid-translocating ATPase